MRRRRRRRLCYTTAQSLTLGISHPTPVLEYHYHGMSYDNDVCVGVDEGVKYIPKHVYYYTAATVTTCNIL